MHRLSVDLQLISDLRDGQKLISHALMLSEPSDPTPRLAGTVRFLARASSHDAFIAAQRHME